MLNQWKEAKKEWKDREVLEAVEKKIKSKEFTKYEPELQNCFRQVKKILSKEFKTTYENE